MKQCAYITFFFYKNSFFLSPVLHPFPSASLRLPLEPNSTAHVKLFFIYVVSPLPPAT